MQAVILAGGSLSGTLKQAFPDTTNKAHLRIDGKMLIEYVLAAALNCLSIEKVFIVGEKDFLSMHICDERVVLMPDLGNVYDNFMQAADCADTDDMLLLTGDIPLLSSADLDIFIDNCQPSGLDIYYSIASKECILRYDEQGRRTYAKTVEGVFTGGNVFRVNVEAVRRARPAIEHIFAKRKSVLALLNMVGIGFVLKYIFGKISLVDIEICAGRILSANVKAVICEQASIGIDVDKMADLELVKRHLS